MLKFLPLCAAALMLSACGTYASGSMKAASDATAAAATQGATAKSPAQVLLTDGDITDRPYVTIGEVSANVMKHSLFDKDPTRAQVDEELKVQAAQRGADAVILVRYGTLGPGVGGLGLSWGVLEGQGRAVIFQK